MEERHWNCATGQWLIEMANFIQFYQDPVLFTGTIASNIAYGNNNVTREEIEAAAREANCEFVWGMPQGFDTESKPIPPFWFTSITFLIFSWTAELEWWSETKACHCKSSVEEACYTGSG
jgi:hypothetical protein